MRENGETVENDRNTGVDLNTDGAVAEGIEEISGTAHQTHTQSEGIFNYHFNRITF